MEEKINPGYKAHLFVCTNGPDKEGKCGSKNSETLRKLVKEKCFEKYGKNVRVNASGCLGYCENGIAAVLYSEKQSTQWKLCLRSNEDAILVDMVEKCLGG